MSVVWILLAVGLKLLWLAINLVVLHDYLDARRQMRDARLGRQLMQARVLTRLARRVRS